MLSWALNNTSLFQYLRPTLLRVPLLQSTPSALGNVGHDRKTKVFSKSWFRKTKVTSITLYILLPRTHAHKHAHTHTPTHACNLCYYTFCCSLKKCKCAIAHFDALWKCANVQLHILLLFKNVQKSNHTFCCFLKCANVQSHILSLF